MQWTGLTRFAISVGLGAMVVGLVPPLGSYDASTAATAAILVATAMLVARQATKLIVVPQIAGPLNPLAAAGPVPAVLIWSCDPDAPGRPRPRAPGRGSAARATWLEPDRN
jgi:Family of unknown function (DUF6412)